MPSTWGHRQQYGEFKIVGAVEGHPKLLGEGSFGKTYEAVRSESVAGNVIEESVALKVLNPDLLNSASKRFQFVQERTALTRLKHANLIHSIKCGEDNGEVYFAMELCMGGDLTKLVKRFGALPERVAALIGLQAAAGLREMHRREMVHRDIKPPNIMLFEPLSTNCTLDELTLLLEENESLCRIVDFGLVGTILNAQGSTGHAAHQKFVGSMMYASPEQILERKSIDGRTDIYALGMTLWYLVQGRGPLLDARGDELKQATEAEGRHLSDRPHDPDLPNNLSQEFRGIVAQMVAKRPEDRIPNARDLAAALERYLARSARAPDVTAVQSRERLQSYYTFKTDPLDGISRRRFAAEHCATQRKARLTIVEDLDDIRRIRADFNEVVKKVSGLAQTLHLPDTPASLLPVQEVIYAADALAYAEDVPGDVTLAEVLQVRTASKRPFSFREAEVIFRPIAEALDYVINNGWDLISLPCEDVWLADAATARAPHDRKVLCRPLDQWAGLRVTFSGMWVPPEKGSATGAEISFASTSRGGSSFITAESLRPPVSAFLRLVYRTLSGSDVPDAADRWPNGYISSVSLQNASNNLIRDLLCKQREWSAVSLILNELCANEGVSVDAPMIPPAEGVGGGSRFKSGTSRPTATGSGTAPPAAPPPLPQPPPAIPTQPPANRSSGSSGNRTPSDANAEGPTPREAREAESCEIVSLGVLRLGDCIQELSALDWATKEFIRSAETGRWFFFPHEGRGLFLGRVDRLKHVFSPYSEQEQEVDWKDWRDENEVTCEKTGHPFLLPQHLPLPTGTLPADGRVGHVVSFFDPQGPLIKVDPSAWLPGGRITCPRTGNDFLLPPSLPPLEAVVDVRKTGWVSSPYAPDAPWTIPPTDWFAGQEIVCNITRNRLTLPPEVEQWVAEATVVDTATREVQSPYNKDARCIVPAMDWRRGGSVKCPPSGRPARLPVDLPLLVGQVVPGVAGVIRSPFTQEQIKVPLPNWITGREVVCAQTGQPFLLPPALPLPDGSVLKDKPGIAFSPYDPTRTVKVEPLHWLPGEVLTCPATGERFKLPQKLPPLHAIITPGDPGLVCSPFAPDASDENEVAFEFRVPIDDWIAGNEFECPVTRHVFILPPDIEEWIQEGTWIPGSPGKVRSPFRNGTVIELQEKDWKPGARVTCTKTGRPFKLPAGEELPSLALEKAAIQYANAEPDADEKAAAAVLKKAHRDADEQVIAAIWARHQLDTPEKRMPKEPGTLIKGEPGFVISPYNQKRMPVPPEVWVLSGASLLCESGKRFLLPANRPPLTGTVDSKKPGFVSSPFAKDKPFQVKPWQWVAGTEIICAHSGHAFALPDPLPAWVPQASLDARKPGCVINPFSPSGDSLPVRGQDWMPENILPVGGRQFKLPKELPPLVASLEKAVRGKVESPYAPGTIIHVKPDLWVHGGVVTCTKTKRDFLLPDSLPDDAFEGIDPHEDGTIQSPYGKGQRFKVLALEWLGEGIVRCPETEKRIVLPKILPLLIGQVDPEHPCRVGSPFDPDNPMTLSVDNWIEGREVACAKTQRTFRLPTTTLPLPFAELATGKPGAVHSPFRNGAEILVPPLQWIEGGEVEDRAARKRFRLPKSALPLLEGVPVTGRSLHVKSPFDPKAEVPVPFADWTPGHQVTCPTTKRLFVLPDHLPEPVLTARIVEDRPGSIIDPYTEAELEVPGADWNDGGTILSPEGRKIVLPAKLPPLLALLIEGAPCQIRSPYEPEAVETVPAKKWTAGNIVKCGGRNVRLPDNLPPPPTSAQRGSPFPWAAMARISAIVLLLGGGAAATFQYWPRGENKPGDVAVISSPPTPPPVEKPTPAIEPKPVVKAPDPVPIPPPPPPPPILAPSLRDQFARQKLAGTISGDLYRDVLKQAESKRQDAEAQKLADEVIEAARKRSDPEIQRLALWDFARRLPQDDQLSEETLNAYLAAYQTSAPEVMKWLEGNVARFSESLFVKAHAALPGGDDKKRLITAGKQSEAKNKEIAATAFYLNAEEERKTAGSTALNVLKEYREAANRSHKAAIKWLLSNVEARPVAALKVQDPFSHDGKTLDIPPAKWKQGTEIEEHYFKLGGGLHPLVARFENGKHRKPEGDARGIVGDPYAEPNGAIEVDRKDWYRGARLMPENIVLPDDLPLMEARIDPAMIAEKSQPVVLSPVTGKPVLLTVMENGKERPAWEKWKKGEVIVEAVPTVEGAERILATSVLPDMVPHDPRLSCSEDETGETVEVSTPDLSLPPKTKCVVASPYTGKRTTLPVSNWLPGQPVEDPNLKDLGVSVTFKLPPKLGPIYCTVVPSPAEDQFGMVAYWGESDTEARKLPLDAALIEQLKEANGVFTRNDQTFRLVRRPDIIVVSKGKGIFRDPLTGRELDKDRVRTIRDQRKNSPNYIPYEIPNEVAEAIREIKVTPPPDTSKEDMSSEKKMASADPKTKSDPDASSKSRTKRSDTAPAGGKEKTAQIGSPTPPPAKNEPTKPAASTDGSAIAWKPKGIRSQRNDVTFAPKGGTLRSNKNANLGSNGEEAAKDQTAVLRGQGMPRSLKVYYDPSTNGFFIGPAK